MNYPIFIPTYGRDKVRTLESLPLTLLKRTVLVVKDIQTGINLTQAHSGVNYLVCPQQGKGIHIVRDWLMSYCHQQNIKVCVMLDDDLKFTVASFVDGKKRFNKPTNLSVLVSKFDSCVRKAMLPKVGMASFSQTFFNTTKQEWVQNKDNASTYFVNVENAFKGGATFLLPSTDDCCFMFGTLEAGYELWSLASVGSTKVGKHGKGGEVSVAGLEARGINHKKSVETLAARYPRFVKARTTNNKRYYENYGTNTIIIKYFSNMWKAVQRGEDVRT